MRHILFVIVIFFILSSCVSKGEQEEFAKIAAGYNENRSFQEKNREQRLLWFLNKSSPDSVVLHEIYSWQPDLSLSMLDYKYFLSDTIPWEKKYAYLRTLEYYGALPDSIFESALLTLSEEKSGKGIELMEDLIECELKYFDYLSSKGLKEYKSVEKALQSSISKYPLALRFKYLLANIYLLTESWNKALSLTSELIEKDYYRFWLLKKKIGYYQTIGDSDQLLSCINSTKKLYPQRCIPEMVFFTRDSDVLRNELSFCFNSRFLSDSIVSTIYLCRRFLSQMEFGALDSMYLSFEKMNKHFQLDSLKIWERGEYFDLKLQSLFMQKKWASFVMFLVSEVGYNKKIIVKNKSDLKLLIQRYYALHSEIFKDVDAEVIYSQVFDAFSKIP